MVLPQRRRLHLESLESRNLLAAEWINPDVAGDVNCDGFVTPADALTIVHCLNGDLIGEACDKADINDSGTITPSDYYELINRLNAANEPADVKTSPILDQDTGQLALILEVSDPDGIHSVSVCLDDADGNFTVISPPAWKDGTRHVTLRFDFNDPLPDGPHDIHVRVNDARGVPTPGEEASPIEVPVIIDTASPQAILVPKPDVGGGGGQIEGESAGADQIGSEFYLLLSEPISENVFDPVSYVIDNGTANASNAVQTIDINTGHALVAILILEKPLALNETIQLADDAAIFDAVGNPLTEITLDESAELDPADWEQSLDNLFANLGE